MIKLNCDNYLIKQTLTNYLENKSISLASENESYFTTINIRANKKNISLIIGSHGIEFSIPVDLNFLSSEILKSIADINLKISGYNY